MSAKDEPSTVGDGTQTGTADVPETAVMDDATRGSIALRAVAGLVIFGLFGLVYAYDVWAALGNFLGVENQAAQLGLRITTIGWFVLYGGIALPAFVWLGFALAFLITALRRARNKRPIPVWRFVVLLVVGLVLVAVFTLDIVLGVPATVMFDTGLAG